MMSCDGDPDCLNNAHNMKESSESLAKLCLLDPVSNVSTMALTEQRLGAVEKVSKKSNSQPAVSYSMNKFLLFGSSVNETNSVTNQVMMVPVKEQRTGSTKWLDCEFHFDVCCFHCRKYTPKES